MIRTFVRRAGRTTTGQAKAFEALGPQFIVPYQAAVADPDTLFGRKAPVVLEIGFGMGDATAHIAGVLPDINFLCCERPTSDGSRKETRPKSSTFTKS